MENAFARIFDVEKPYGSFQISPAKQNNYDRQPFAASANRGWSDAKTGKHSGIGRVLPAFLSRP
ncbi:MAG: hypothetical protein ACUVSK_13630 [Desulfotomaculales bacterium]